MKARNVFIAAAVLAALALPAAASAAPDKTSDTAPICSHLNVTSLTVKRSGTTGTVSFRLKNFGTCGTTLTSISLVRRGGGAINWKRVKLAGTTLVCADPGHLIAYEVKGQPTAYYPGVTCLVPATLGDPFAPMAAQTGTATFTAKTGASFGLTTAIDH